MRLPRRTRRPVYTVCDAKQALGGDGGDRETSLEGALRAQRRAREADIDGPSRVERGGDRDVELEGPLRRQSGGDCEADLEAPTSRRRRRVVAVIVPAATASIALALALMLLRPAGGGRRPDIGPAKGAARLSETNVSATNTPAGSKPAGRLTPIGRLTSISRQAPALRSAPAARADVRASLRHSGRSVEAPQPIVPVEPIVLLDVPRPVLRSAPVVAAAEFGFER